MTGYYIWVSDQISIGKKVSISSCENIKGDVSEMKLVIILKLIR